MERKERKEWGPRGKESSNANKLMNEKEKDKEEKKKERQYDEDRPSFITHLKIAREAVRKRYISDPNHSLPQIPSHLIPDAGGRE